MGEDLMAQLFAAYLAAVRKVPASYLSPEDADLVVSAEFSNAYPLPETPERLKRKLADRPGITIFPGFFGATPDGRRATFSRGGSDLTGSLLAEAVDADVYENWTDVDGICRADPTVVKDPELMTEVTYREIRELAYIGFNVIHHDAILPARRKRIPINLRNTNNLAAKGTMIVDSRVPLAEVVVGIAAKKDFCCFTIEKYLMNREIGFGRRVLSILEEAGLSFEHMPSGIDSISVYLDQNQLRSTEMTGEIVRRMYRDLSAEKVEVEHDKAMVIAVGEGMKHHVGVAARLVAALARQKFNIEMINQGASELSIIVGVRAEDAESAVRALYDEYFGPQRRVGAKNGAAANGDGDGNGSNAKA
jgi:aspartate kinase